MKKYQLRVSLHEVGEDGSISNKPHLEMRISNVISELNAKNVPTVMERLYGDFDYSGWHYKEDAPQGNRYEIEFGNHLAAGIEIIDNIPTVYGAVNGWGNGVPISEIKIKKAIK